MLLIVNFMLPGLMHENVIQKYKIEILLSTRSLGVLHISLALPVRDVQEAVGKWRTLHTEELHDVTSPPSTVWPVALMRDALDT